MIKNLLAQYFARRFNAGADLEIFVVAAVASVLLIRLFLELTGYPQVGGDTLHIAHMLWGGLLMMIALLILLCLLGRNAERIASLVGGIGFGTFIDEVGKFITKDNDYFFRPAIALIYLSFVGLFFLARAVQNAQKYSPQEYLLNALRLFEEIVIRDLDVEERRRLHDYLGKSGQRSALVSALETASLAAETSLVTRFNLLERVKNLIGEFYKRVARMWWFPSAVILFFLAQLGIKLLYAFILIFIVGLGWNEILDFGIVNRVVAQFRNLSFIDWIEIGFSLLSGAFVLWGIISMRRSRITAFEWFARSVLISILITQVFAFYKEQFSALLGLLLNIAALIGVRFVIEQERAAKNELSNAREGGEI